MMKKMTALLVAALMCSILLLGCVAAPVSTEPTEKETEPAEVKTESTETETKPTENEADSDEQETENTEATTVPTEIQPKESESTNSGGGESSGLETDLI